MMADDPTPQILIIGSDEAARRYVRQSLTRRELRCTCVSAPRDARRALRLEPIDAALLDISSFAPKDAAELTRWLLREAGDLPLVIVTGAADSELIAETRLGGIDYLRHPVSNEELCAAIDRALRWRRDTRSGGSRLEHWSSDMERRAAALVRGCVETGIASSAALEAWVGTIYVRDAWTAGHVHRVAHLAVLTGRALGLEEAELAQLRRAALLHDIGRLAIPEELLRKPEPLSVGERALIRNHVKVGSQVAASTSFLEPLAETLLSVRERYAGGGYPRGLRGEDIPLGARVIAVAEAFDALSCAQTTGKASIDAINAELVRARSGFDPDVVRAWLRCVDDGLLTAPVPDCWDSQ